MHADFSCVLRRCLNLANTKVLFVNFFPNSLINELNKRRYDITTFNTRGGNCLLSSSSIENFDIVYFAKMYPPMWDDVGLILKRNRTPVIYAFHAPLIIFHPYRPTNHFLNFVSLMKIFYIRLNRSIAAIHVLNTNEYRIIRYLGFKCYFTPLGVDTSLFKPGRRSDKFTVVFVGPRFGKGVDMLSRIIPMVLRKAPEIKFALAGEGFLDKYFALLRDTFRNNVEIYGSLPQEEFAKLLATSHVFLFLSRYETFGLATLEALSCGVPVVCFRIAGTPKDIILTQKAGIVVDPFAIDKIVNGIIDYYEMWKSNASEFDRLSVACRNVALKFDWRIIAELFDHMFKDVSKFE